MKKTLPSILFMFINIITAVASGHTATISSFSNTTCNGVCDAFATATVSGGVGPFSYSWSPSGGTSATASGLCAGSYTVTVTDNSDMSITTATIVITEPPLLSVSIGGGGGAVCPGGCTTLNALGTGGTPGYTFLWSPSGSMLSAYSACPVSGSTYTVSITDGNGCIGTAITSLSVNPLDDASFSYSSSNYCQTGINPIPFIGGPAPGIFSVSPIGLIFVSVTTGEVDLAGSLLGTYTITFSTGGPCPNSSSVNLTIGGSIGSGISSTNATGCGVCDGAASVSPTGGSAPYSYSWSNGSSLYNPSSLCSGTYSIVITDVAGCTITDSTTVFAANDISANFTMVPDSTNAFNFFGFNSSTGTGNTYTWDFGGAGTSMSSNPTFLFPSPGTYNVSLIANNAVCGADTLSQAVTVTGTLSTCLSLFNIADDTTSADPNSHYIYNLSYGSSLTYLWDFGDGATSTLATPSHIYTATGPYNICLTVDNGSGCTQTFCDSLISADSLNRSSGIMQFVVYDVPPFNGITTGIASKNDLSAVSVFPNPFSDITTFIIESEKTSEIYSFELVDMLGKKVKSVDNISEKQFQISRSGLQNGIYFYKVYSSRNVLEIGKLVIN